MKLNLADLKEGITVLDLSEDAKDMGFDAKDEIRFEGPIFSNIEVNNMVDKIGLKGRIKAKAMLECGRCLEKFDYNIDTSFDLIYTRSSAAKDGEIEKEQFDELVLTGDTINLNNDVRQTIILDLPMQYLCKESCKGLCPVCGKDRNREKCNCTFQRENPFGKLKLNKQ